MLILGTGISGPVLLGGQTYHGTGGAHPMIDHIAAQPDGVECFCARNDCLKNIATGPAISDASAEISLDRSEAVFATAAASEPKATAIINAMTGSPK